MELKSPCIENKQTSEQADKQANKHTVTILKMLKDVSEATTAEIAATIGLSPARTRAILTNMDEIEAVGVTNTRRYRIK